MANPPTDEERIAALKAAQADQAREIAELSLPRLKRLGELLQARRDNTAELEKLAAEVPYPNADTLLAILINGALSGSETQVVPLLANAVQVMTEGCELTLAPPAEA